MNEPQPPGGNLAEDQPLRHDAPMSQPGGNRSLRRGRFILGRVVLVIVILAAVVLLAPFIYSIWLVSQGHIGAF